MPLQIALLTVGLSLLSTAVSASTLITWEFSGALSTTTERFGLADLYPAGTPFTLNITFDPDAPRFPRTPGPYGLYPAIRAATFQIGNTTTTASSGYIAVNCHAGLGCPDFPPGHTVQDGYVEFLMFPFSSQNPPLNPNSGLTRVSPLEVAYFDPNVLTGAIPLIPPSGPASVFIGIGGNPGDPFTTLFGGVPSVQSIDEVAVVPEPASFLLFATGLAGLRARWRKKR